MSVNTDNDSGGLHRRHELQDESNHGYPANYTPAHEVEFSSTTQLDTYFSDEKVMIPELEKVTTK